MSDTTTTRPRHVAPQPLAGVAALARAEVSGAVTEVLVTGVSQDSGTVQPGDLYAALPGSRTHGARFASDAAHAGAVAVLTDSGGAEVAAGSGLPVLAVAHPREVLGDVAAYVYGRPGEQLTMLGVTGTNGKTTTTYLLDGGLRAAGRRTGLIGTIGIHILDEQVPTSRTTPEAPEVQALLAVMLERGVQACAMEVSSHALAFDRVGGLVFDVVGFTNLTQDHLDYHVDMEDYFAAKATLFTPRLARRGVVCVDDSWGVRLAAQAGIPVSTMSLTGTEADWQVEHTPSADGSGSHAVLRGPAGVELVLDVPLPGDFNVANAALALLMLLATGLDASTAAKGIGATPGVPGRMQRVQGARSGAPVGIVDYAHTPDAVRSALEALRPYVPGRLVVVLGAGGDRDHSKRAPMGELAARGADVLLVTDDNPRSEDAGDIRAQVLAGALAVPPAERGEVLEVSGRSAAIRQAVALASAGDWVLVAGKGHEQGQEIEGVVHPFDDRTELRAALQEIPA